MKLWVDAVISAPDGYVWIKSVNDAQLVIETKERNVQWFSDRAYELEADNRFELAKRLGMGVVSSTIELIDINRDDYTKLFGWLKETKRNYPTHIHSEMNEEVYK